MNPTTVLSAECLVLDESDSALCPSATSALIFFREVYGRSA